jgi:6-phosphofructokinase 1
MDTEELCLRLERNFKAGKRSAIVIVAEGDQPGDSFRIAQQVKERTNFDSRVCVLGHIQRGGSPTVRDRVLASRLGISAVQALVEGRTGVMVGEVDRDISLTPLQDTWEKKKEIHPCLTDMLRYLSD